MSTVGIATAYQGYTVFQLLGDRKVAIAPPETSLAIFTTNPDSNGLNYVEVSTSGTGYARVNVPNDGGSWEVAGFEARNVQFYQYPRPSVNWGTVVGWGLFLNSGSLFLWGSMFDASVVLDGYPVWIKPGGLVIGIP